MPSWTHRCSHDDIFLPEPDVPGEEGAGQLGLQGAVAGVALADPLGEDAVAEHADARLLQGAQQDGVGGGQRAVAEHLREERLRLYNRGVWT